MDTDKFPAKLNGEKQFYAKKDRVCILGTAPTLQDTPWDDENEEIWALSQCVTFPVFKRADMLFELHSEDYWIQDEGITKRLQAWEGITLMHKKFDYIKSSEKYPIKTILSYKRYQRSSITYMIALAYHSFKITGKPKHVSLYGVHMEDEKEEYGEQRPCCEYWIGRMEDAGQELFIAGGAILSAPFLYGYEKYSPMALELSQRYHALLNGKEEREKEMREAQLQANKQLGAAMEAEYWLRKAQRGELQNGEDHPDV